MRSYRSPLLTAALFALLAGIAFPQDASPGATGVRSLKINRTVSPIFPPAAQLMAIRNGEVNLALSIDRAGRIEDALLVAYTHRVFADEVLRTVKRWEYTPAQLQGEAVGAVIEFTVSFRQEGIMITQNSSIWTPEDRFKIGDPFEYKPHGLGSLDAIPVPQKVSPPSYPSAWAAEGRKGDVTVDFFIDETGRTRMAAAAAQGDRLLSSAAVAAVQNWRFDPPTQHGKPVLVRAQQVFHFDPAQKP